MIRPPGIDNVAFVMSPDTLCYALVLLLCSASAAIDTAFKSFECALLSTMETYKDPENGSHINYIDYLIYSHYTYFNVWMHGPASLGRVSFELLR